MDVVYNRGLVTYLDKRVIEEKHSSSKIPSPLLSPEEHLANITNIFDLRVAQAKLPDDEGRIQDKCSNDNCKD